jgi:hypothetical protein
VLQLGGVGPGMRRGWEFAEGSVKDVLTVCGLQRCVDTCHAPDNDVSV